MILPVALMLAQSAARPTEVRRPGFGERQLERTCGACHPLDPVREAHLSREDWGLELDKMEVIGAKIENRKALLDYLAHRYGPGKRTTRALPVR